MSKYQNLINDVEDPAQKAMLMIQGDKLLVSESLLNLEIEKARRKHGIQPPNLRRNGIPTVPFSRKPNGAPPVPQVPQVPQAPQTTLSNKELAAKLPPISQKQASLDAFTRRRDIKNWITFHEGPELQSVKKEQTILLLEKSVSFRIRYPEIFSFALAGILPPNDSPLWDPYYRMAVHIIQQKKGVEDGLAKQNWQLNQEKKAWIRSLWRGYFQGSKEDFIKNQEQELQKYSNNC